MTNSPTTEVVTSNLPTAGTYNIDAVHSTVGFVARHLVASKVRGRFTDFTGAITIGDTPETSSVQATVQAASITTDNDMRDAHLKSPDFLEFETYPTLTLTSTKVSAKGDNYEVVADLTIKGITKSVTFGDHVPGVLLVTMGYGRKPEGQGRQVHDRRARRPGLDHLGLVVRAAPSSQASRRITAGRERVAWQEAVSVTTWLLRRSRRFVTGVSPSH